MTPTHTIDARMADNCTGAIRVTATYMAITHAAATNACDRP